MQRLMICLWRGGIPAYGIVTMNGIPEALVSGIIITPIVMMLKKSGWKMK